MTRIRLLFCIPVFLLYCSKLVCQQIKPVVLTKYTQKEGLSSYFVTKIIRDSYGFTWVATQEGLNIFDGHEFQVFSSYSDAKHRLGGNFVSDIIEDKRRNLLWVLTAYGDICAIDLNTRIIKKRITSYENGLHLSAQWLQSLCIVGDTLLIGGNNGLRAFQIEKNLFLPLDPIKIGLHQPVMNVAKQLIDHYGRVWIFADGFGIFVLDSHLKLRHQYTRTFGDSNYVGQTLRFWDACLYNDTIYLATSLGLRSFGAGISLSLKSLHPTNTLLDKEGIFSVCIGEASKIFCSLRNHVYCYDPNTRELLIYKDFSADEDWLSLTRQMYYDRLNRQMWVGTQAGLGTYFLKQPALTPFSTSDMTGSPVKHLYSLLPDGTNKIYCADENGFYHVDLVNRNAVRLDSTNSTLLVFRVGKANILVSNNRGLFLLKGKGLEVAKKYYPELKKLDHDQFNCGFQFNDSLVVLSSILRKGLIVWNTVSKTVKRYHQASPLHQVNQLTIINFLVKTKRSSLLVLTEKSIIEFNILSGDYKTHYLMGSQVNDTLTNLMDACETANRFWFASYGGGLIETDKEFHTKKIFTNADGLSNPSIYRLFSFHDEQIIATTNYGLSVINCLDYQVRNYFQSDGIHSDAFEQLCGFQSSDTIYAGGVKGFTIINPALFIDNPLPPKLFLKQVIIKAASGLTDTSDYTLTSIKIPNDIQQVSFKFSALNYSNPGQVTYAYRIMELQSKWITLGHNNSVDLLSLPPGRYTLLVTVTNESGITNGVPLSIELQYLPKWYQTLLFKMGVFLSATLLIYAAVRYRITQIKRQQQIRKEIASDLHDDIGSSLNSIKIFAHLARREPTNAQYFVKIEDSLAQVTAGLRDIIWVLDDSRDSFFELMERIRNFAWEPCNGQQITFSTIMLDGSSGVLLSKAEKRNLLMIAKEAINNSLKYAHCSKIDITLKEHTNKIVMIITDDGIGFDQQNKSNGYGLKNMQFRAGQIKFDLSVKSIVGKGTFIELTKV